MSPLRCWPGCLAVYVGPPEVVVLDGESLTVCSYGTPFEVQELAARRDGAFWRVKPRHVRVESSAGRYFEGDLVEVRDACLLPITPPPAADSTNTTADKPQPVEA